MLRYPNAVEQRWVHLDASNQVVGRLAQDIVKLLVGKDKPTFHRSQDLGDYVVVTNAQYLNFSGKKWEQKVYRHHTRFAGGLKTVPAARVFAKHPEYVLQRAVSGMLPRNRLRSKRLKRLKVFGGPFHPYGDKVYAPRPKENLRLRMDHRVLATKSVVETSKNTLQDETWKDVLSKDDKKLLKRRTRKGISDLEYVQKKLKYDKSGPRVKRKELSKLGGVVPNPRRKTYRDNHIDRKVIRLTKAKPASKLSRAEYNRKKYREIDNKKNKDRRIMWEDVKFPFHTPENAEALLE